MKNKSKGKLKITSIKASNLSKEERKKRLFEVFDILLSKETRKSQKKGSNK